MSAITLLLLDIDARQKMTLVQLTYAFVRPDQNSFELQKVDPFATQSSMTEFAPVTHGRTLARQTLPWCNLTTTSHSDCFRIEPHAHRHAALTFVLRGLSQSIECDSATLLFKPAGCIHSNSYGANGATSIIAEITRPEFLGISASRLPNKAIAIDSVEQKCVARELARTLKFQDTAFLSTQTILIECLANIMHRSKLEPESVTEPKWFLEAEKHIRSNLASPLTLNRIAEHVGVHPGHLAREFRRHSSKSVGEFVRNLRLERAVHFLLTTDWAITSIAHELGFCDSSHFTRVFRKFHGVTPSQYRAQHRPR